MAKGTMLAAAVLTLSATFAGGYLCTRVTATAVHPQKNVVRIQADNAEDPENFQCDHWRQVK